MPFLLLLHKSPARRQLLQKVIGLIHAFIGKPNNDAINLPHSIPYYESKIMREVCVIGTGVIGLTSAFFLAEAGWKVRLVDKASDVGSGTSYMNGGQLSYRYVSPLADSGVPFKAIKWLFEQDGPLRFKPQLDPGQWYWLIQFLLHCNEKANRSTTRRLALLGQYSRQCMATLINEHKLPDFSWRESGKLVVYRNKSTFANATRQIPKDDPQQILTPDECLRQEPAIAQLQSHLAGGIYTSSEAVADCHAFCLAIQKKLEAHPNYLGRLEAKVIQFEFAANKRLRLLTSDGFIDSPDFVLAAGTASRFLAATVGIKLPISPLKGYSLNVPIHDENRAPETSVTDFEKKVLYARIGNRLRISAMVDMVGDDDSIEPHRIDSLLHIARRDMPGAGDYDQADKWAGLRPATPSGEPVIGPSAIPGLWFNVGHGALGFTFACGSAGTLANLMTDGLPPEELNGLRWLNY